MRGDPPPHKPLYINGFKSTPHARGSTAIFKLSINCFMVYPACAGIHPAGNVSQEAIRRLPRMRGDPPVRGSANVRGLASTPHARGSTARL